MLSFLAFSNWFSIQFGLCCSMLHIIFCVTCLGLFFFFPIMLSKHTRTKLSFSLLHLSSVVPIKSSVVFPSSNIRHIITIKIQTRRPAFFDSTQVFGIFLSDSKKKYLIGGGKHAITVGSLLITIDTAWAASFVKPLKRKKEGMINTEHCCFTCSFEHYQWPILEVTEIHCPDTHGSWYLLWQRSKLSFHDADNAWTYEDLMYSSLLFLKGNNPTNWFSMWIVFVWSAQFTLDIYVGLKEWACPFHIEEDNTKHQFKPVYEPGYIHLVLERLLHLPQKDMSLRLTYLPHHITTEYYHLLLSKYWH